MSMSKHGNIFHFELKKNAANFRAMNEKIKRETKIINLPKNLILVNFFSAKSWLNRRVEEKK